MKPVRTLIILAAVAVVVPASAEAAGGPLITTAATDEVGIESADGEYRYTPLISGGRTAVLKIARGSGLIDAWSRKASENFRFLGIPQVAADGSRAGLSADGGTLVLIGAYGPINRAELVVLGTNKLRELNRIELDGQYSFDAISPDGRTAYVVEYPKPLRYDRYRVLKLDLKTGRLAEEPVADEDVGLDEAEEEGGEGAVEGEMRGLALSRVDSGDGRWAYTLYDGGGDVPFIHALDTVGDRAVCIFMPELDDLDRNQIAKATIATGSEPETLAVMGRADHEAYELARVDTGTFAVTTPGDEVSESGSAVPLPLAIGLALAVVAIGSITILRRRGRSEG